MRTSARHDRIIRMYRDDNLSSVEIARKMGLAPSSVARVIQKRGLTRPNGWFAKPNPRIVARDKRIIELYTKDKLTSEKIAPLVGLTQSGVIQALKRRGITPRQTGSWSPRRPKKFYEMRAYAKQIAPFIGTGPNTTIAAMARARGYLPATLRLHLNAIGSNHPIGGGASTRLDVTKVTAIKKALLAGTPSQAALAKKYGVGTSTIWAISTGRSWDRVPWPGGKKYVPRSPLAGRRARRGTKPRKK